MGAEGATRREFMKLMAAPDVVLGAGVPQASQLTGTSGTVMSPYSERSPVPEVVCVSSSPGPRTV